VINVDKNVLHALDFCDAGDETIAGVESISSLLTISGFDELVIWILDFADARTVRVPRQFSAPSGILDFGQIDYATTAWWLPPKGRLSVTPTVQVLDLGSISG
jgi:hypothetical protein